MTTPPDHITRQDFGISVRGYDRSQVDAYLGRVVEWLADAENRATAAERARESLAREVTELRTTVAMLEERAGLPAPQSMSAFSERMSQVMESALQAAQELRAEAEREARERRASATEEAERVVAAARDEAEQIVRDARREQETMEASIDRLHAARAAAVESLLELQRRLAVVVDEPLPPLEGAESAESAEEPAHPSDVAAGGDEQVLDRLATTRPAGTTSAASTGSTTHRSTTHRGTSRGWCRRWSPTRRASDRARRNPPTQRASS